MKASKVKNDNSKPKYKYVLYLLSASVFIILIIWFLGYLMGSNLGKFPFDPQSWGTASDYFGILVTGISLYFIYRTLKAQQTSLDQQSEVIKLQNEELRLNRLDRRKLYNPKINADVTEDSEKKEYLIELICAGDALHNVDLRFHNAQQVIYDIFTEEYVKAQHRFKVKYGLLNQNQNIPIIIKEPIKWPFTISLEFEDFYGLRYRQTIIIYSPNRKSYLGLIHLP